MDTIKAVSVTGDGGRSALVPIPRKTGRKIRLMSILWSGKKHQYFVQRVVFNEQ
jgi:hypothetical protein